MDRCGVLACTPARRLHSCSQWRARSQPCMRNSTGDDARLRGPCARAADLQRDRAVACRVQHAVARAGAQRRHCCGSRHHSTHPAAPPTLAAIRTRRALLVRPSPRAFPGACATAQIARVVCGVSRFACASHAAEGLAVGWPHSACMHAHVWLRVVCGTFCIHAAGVRGIRPQHKRAHERGEGVYQGGAKTLAWLLAPLQAWATAWQSFRTRFKWLTAIVQPCEARERDDLRGAREDRPPVRGSNAPHRAGTRCK